MRSSIPLSQLLIAVIVAAAAAGGMFVFLRSREAPRSSAATLSFDAAHAPQLGSEIVQPSHPAVALGESILTNSVVSGLIAKNDPATSSSMGIGEYRARIELTQPAAGSLEVSYNDPDAGRSIANANAIAETLAAWAPPAASDATASRNEDSDPAPDPKSAAAADSAGPVSQVPPAPSAAASPTPPAPSATALPQAAAAGTSSASSTPPAPPPGASLADALGGVVAQLSAAERQSGSGSAGKSLHDRQRHLESQMHDIQQDFGALRNKFDGTSSTAGGQARLVTIQRAFAQFWPKAAGLATAGTSEAQFSYEREQLVRDIGLVQQQQKAAQREEADRPASAAGEPAGSASSTSASAGPKVTQSALDNSAQPNAETSAAKPGSAPLQPAAAGDAQTQSDAGADAPVPAAAGPGSGHPFQLQRRAEPAGPVPLWPSALAGCVCGLFYFGIATIHHHSTSDSGDVLSLRETNFRSSGRSFDSGTRARNDIHEEWIDIHPRSDDARQESAPAKPDPDPVAAPHESQHVNPAPSERAGFERDREAREGKPSMADKIFDLRPNAQEIQNGAAESQAASSGEADVPQRAEMESENASPRDNSEAADPWDEEMRKNLEQTSVGRLLNRTPVSENAAPSKGPFRDEGPTLPENGRRTG